MTAELQKVKTNKVEQDEFDKEIYDLKNAIANIGSGKPVEIRASSPKGPKISQEDIDKWNNASKLIEAHENCINKLNKKIEEVDSIKVDIKELNVQMVQCIFKDEFSKHLHTVNSIKAQGDENTHDISVLKTEIEKLKKMMANLDFASKGEFDMLKTRVDNLENLIS